MSSDTASKVLGLDIGGANLKIADAHGRSHWCSFPMWTDHKLLSARLADLCRQFSVSTQTTYDRLAVTMTGEMADCFASRREGVGFILDHVSLAHPEMPIEVYTVEGTWLTLQTAKRDPWLVASSNWHALASWLCHSPLTANINLRLVVDIGSTTVDVIPVNEFGVVTNARTDSDRLRLQQLVYTGISRTPVAAILSQLEINGIHYPLVAERFATSDDAYVALGLVAATDHRAVVGNQLHADADTADGRPRSVDHARARLARMLGEDADRLVENEIDELAKQIIAAQASKIAAAMDLQLSSLTSVSQRPRVMFSGHGRVLADEALKRLKASVECIFLEDLVSAEAARCAPAVAVAWLLQRQASLSVR
jgi:probable H4MPT-linked C1 transfer pathway protein